MPYRPLRPLRLLRLLRPSKASFRQSLSPTRRRLRPPCPPSLKTKATLQIRPCPKTAPGRQPPRQRPRPRKAPPPRDNSSLRKATRRRFYKLRRSLRSAALGPGGILPPNKNATGRNLAGRPLANRSWQRPKRKLLGEWVRPSSTIRKLLGAQNAAMEGQRPGFMPA